MMLNENLLTTHSLLKPLDRQGYTRAYQAKQNGTSFYIPKVRVEGGPCVPSYLAMSDQMRHKTSHIRIKTGNNWSRDGREKAEAAVPSRRGCE